jgi:hypothetical protein
VFARPEPARSATRATSPRATAVVMLAIAGGLVWWRWAALDRHGDPVGVDIGNWLALGNAIGGHHVSGADTVYPPLIPATIRALAMLSGVPTAARASAALAAILPGCGAWFALRPSVGTRWATLAALGLAGAGATSAAAAWGGLPQLVGLGLAPVVVVLAARLVGRPTRRTTILLGTLLLVLAGVSPLVFGLTLVSVVLTLALVACVTRADGWFRHAAVAGAFTLPAFPLYVRFLSSATIRTTAPGNAVPVVGALRTVFVGAPLAWYLLGVLAVVAPAATWSSRFDPLWAASTAMTVTAALAALAFAEARFSYLAPTAALVGAATLAAWSRGPFRILLAVAVVTGVLVIVVAAPGTMHEERDLYARFVPRGTSTALRWVDAHTGPRDLFAVAPVAGVPFGWWVEGWGRRPSLVGSDDRWLDFPGERRRAELATRLFTGTHWPSEHALDLARRAGVRWLYLPSGWGGIDRAALRAARSRHPGLVAYRGAGALVLRVPEPDAHP